jgi:hypothetical protein
MLEQPIDPESPAGTGLSDGAAIPACAELVANTRLRRLELNFPYDGPCWSLLDAEQADPVYGEHFRIIMSGPTKNPQIAFVILLIAEPRAVSLLAALGHHAACDG